MDVKGVQSTASNDLVQRNKEKKKRLIVQIEIPVKIISQCFVCHQKWQTNAVFVSSAVFGFLNYMFIDAQPIFAINNYRRENPVSVKDCC